MAQVMERYRGWDLRWTGWKGSKSLSPREPGSCAVCKKDIRQGEYVWRDIRVSEMKHWACHAEPDYLVAQWVGMQPQENPAKYMYASTPGGEGPYLRGAMLEIDVRPGQTRITDESSHNELEQAKNEALFRLKDCIDLEEANPSGFWGAPEAQQVAP